MIIVLVACLIGVSLYLAKRLSEANTALRSQVASLQETAQKRSILSAQRMSRPGIR